MAVASRCSRRWTRVGVERKWSGSPQPRRRGSLGPGSPGCAESAPQRFRASRAGDASRQPEISTNTGLRSLESSAVHAQPVPPERGRHRLCHQARRAGITRAVRDTRKIHERPATHRAAGNQAPPIHSLGRRIVTHPCWQMPRDHRPGHHPTRSSLWCKSWCELQVTSVDQSMLWLVRLSVGSPVEGVVDTVVPARNEKVIPLTTRKSPNVGARVEQMHPSRTPGSLSQFARAG